jgi:hypothetical protein
MYGNDVCHHLMRHTCLREYWGASVKSAIVLQVGLRGTLEL